MHFNVVYACFRIHVAWSEKLFSILKFANRSGLSYLGLETVYFTLAFVHAGAFDQIIQVIKNPYLWFLRISYVNPMLTFLNPAVDPILRLVHTEQVTRTSVEK